MGVGAFAGHRVAGLGNRPGLQRGQHVGYFRHGERDAAGLDAGSLDQGLVRHLLHGLLALGLQGVTPAAVSPCIVGRHHIALPIAESTGTIPVTRLVPVGKRSNPMEHSESAKAGIGVSSPVGNALKRLSDVCKNGAAGLKRLSEELHLSPTCHDFAENITDHYHCARLGKPSHEDLVSSAIEQYLGYFYKLHPIAKNAMTSEAEISAFTTRVPWLRMSGNDSAAGHEPVSIVEAYDIVCKSIIRSKTLTEFLAGEGKVATKRGQVKIAGERIVQEDEREVFVHLGKAIRAPKKRAAHHWAIVRHFLKAQIRLLQNALQCLRDNQPLPEETVSELAMCFCLGRVEAEFHIGFEKPWHFKLAFHPEYTTALSLPHQVHVAKLLAAPVAFSLCLELDQFNTRILADAREVKKFRFIRKCKAPSCGKVFYTGDNRAVVCPRERGAEGRSGCRLEYDQYVQYFLRREYVGNPSKYKGLSFDEFTAKHHGDDNLRSEFLARRHNES